MHVQLNISLGLLLPSSLSSKDITSYMGKKVFFYSRDTLYFDVLEVVSLTLYNVSRITVIESAIYLKIQERKA